MKDKNITYGVIAVLAIIALGFLVHKYNPDLFAMYSPSTIVSPYKATWGPYQIQGNKETITNIEGQITKGGTCNDYAKYRGFVNAGTYMMGVYKVYHWNELSQVKLPICRNSVCPMPSYDLNKNTKETFSILCYEQSPQTIMMANRFFVWDFMNHFELRCIEGNCL